VALKFPKGVAVDPEFVRFAESMFAELKISPEVGQAIADRWQQYAGARVASEAAATQRELDAFRAEMGAGYDEAIAAGQKAALSLGLNGAALQAIERTLGTAPMARLMTAIGKHLAPGAPPSGTGAAPGQGGGMLTPEQAKAEIARLSRSKEFQDSLFDKRHSLHVANVERQSQLFAMAYPAPEPAAAPSAPASAPQRSEGAQSSVVRPDLHPDVRQAVAERDAGGKRAWALAEIERLRSDSAFQSEMRAPGPNREAAVQRWSGLHEAAYGPEPGNAQ
jgi:hypothetical protein